MEEARTLSGPHLPHAEEPVRLSASDAPQHRIGIHDDVWGRAFLLIFSCLCGLVAVLLAYFYFQRPEHLLSSAIEESLLNKERSQAALCLYYVRSLQFNLRQLIALRFLGMIVGAFCILLGALFVLKGIETSYQFKLNSDRASSSLSTTSPGLVLITMGVVLVVWSQYHDQELISGSAPACDQLLRPPESTVLGENSAARSALVQRALDRFVGPAARPPALPALPNLPALPALPDLGSASPNGTPRPDPATGEPPLPNAGLRSDPNPHSDPASDASSRPAVNKKHKAGKRQRDRSDGASPSGKTSRTDRREGAPLPTSAGSASTTAGAATTESPSESQGHP